MPRHTSFVPHGVIPAVLLPFHDDLSIDEKSFRSHLRDVAATPGISAVTINAHSTEVASCSFDEQRRVLEITQDEIGSKLPIINGVWADGSLEAARIARMATPSAWLLSSLVLGCNGLLSGSGSVIADLQAQLFRAVQDNDLATAKRLNDRIYPLGGVFYAEPWADMHNRMKEALVLLDRLP